MLNIVMPIDGEYEPSTAAWVRDQVELQDGPRRQDMTARELSGDERAAWWARAVAAYPPYAQYQQRTTRQIPVFVLEPVD